MSAPDGMALPCMLPAFVPCPCISKVSLKLLCYAGALLLALCKKPSTKMADALANHHERETARCHDLYKQINKANIYIYINPMPCKQLDSIPMRWKR